MYHAYVIVGSSHQGLAYLAKTWQIVEAPLTVSTFGIYHSRQIKEEQSRKVAAGERRHVILICDVITVEAQNALLKTFEEPTPGVHLFLIIPDKTSILPTLLSRSELIELKSADSEMISEAKNFLNSSPEARLEFIAKFVEDYEEPAALKRASQKFGTALLAQVRTEVAETAVRYLYDRAALPRLVLEHLAVIL